MMWKAASKRRMRKESCYRLCRERIIHFVDGANKKLRLNLLPLRKRLRQASSVWSPTELVNIRLVANTKLTQPGGFLKLCDQFFHQNHLMSPLSVFLVFDDSADGVGSVDSSESSDSSHSRSFFSRYPIPSRISIANFLNKSAFTIAIPFFCLFRDDDLSPLSNLCRTKQKFAVVELFHSNHLIFIILNRMESDESSSYKSYPSATKQVLWIQMCKRNVKNEIHSQDSCFCVI